MENPIERDEQDCIIARRTCCGSIIFATVNQPGLISKKDREEIGALAASGLSIEHLTAAEVRKQKWGCKCARP